MKISVNLYLEMKTIERIRETARRTGMGSSALVEAMVLPGLDCLDRHYVSPKEVLERKLWRGSRGLRSLKKRQKVKTY